MSNWQATGPPGQYGQPNPYGQPLPYGQPQHFGYGGAPGTMGPPGVMPGSQPSGGFGPPPSQPPNMPNINFNAPVIRMGTDGSGRSGMAGAPSRGRGDANAEPLGGSRRAGIGFDGRDGDRRRRDPSPPPGYEDSMRTLFVGNITENFGGMQNLDDILNSSQGLHRFKRPYDVKGKPCNFGFAEFRDADSLEAAKITLQHAKLPLQAQVNGASAPGPNSVVQTDGVSSNQPANPGTAVDHPEVNGESTAAKGDEEGEGQASTTDHQAEANERNNMVQLEIISDEKSEEYVDQWRQRGSMRDPAGAQFRLDSAREELAQILSRIARGTGSVDLNGINDGHGSNFENAEIVNIPDRPEDAYGSVPAEMQEQVKEEIANFRNRSSIRELERFKKEKKQEEDERNRAFEQRVNAGIKAEQLPTGPRERGQRGQAGNRAHKDTRDGIPFTGGKHLAPMSKADEDSDADDEEIEKRRNKKYQASLEADFARLELNWLDREKRTGRSVQRSLKVDAEDATQKEQRRRENFEKFTSLRNDDAQKRREWRRNMQGRRERERVADDKDREEEKREQQAVEERRRRDLGDADNFLQQHASEVERIQQDGPSAEPPMSMSLGFALQKAQERKQQQIRAVAGVEHLLDTGEEEEAPLQLRKLEEADPAALMEPQDTKAAVEKLVNEIPDEAEAVFKFPVDWTYLDGDVVNTKLRPFVAKEIRAAVGNEEDMLVDAIVQGISKHESARAIVEEIEDALDEQAENIVRKTWRHLIFYVEAEKRGIDY